MIQGYWHRQTQTRHLNHYLCHLATLGRNRIGYCEVLIPQETLLGCSSRQYSHESTTRRIY